MVEFPTFKGFGETTKLHGFPKIAEGSKGTKVFWAVLVLICISMAIRDLYKLATTYQAGNTAISLTLGNNNNNANFSWPDPTLCMEILVEYVDHTYDPSTGMPKLAPSGSTHGVMDRFLWESKGIAPAQLYLYNGYISNFMALYNAFTTDSNLSVINYYDAFQDSNVMYYPYMLLGYLADLEQQLIGEDRSVLKNYQLNLAQNDVMVTNGGRLQPFFDLYTKNNVSMTKLTQLVGMWYCLQQFKDPCDDTMNTGNSIYGYFENYRYFGDPEYKTPALCRPDLITYVGFSMVCTKLPLQMTSDYNTFAIYDTQFSQSKKSVPGMPGMPDIATAKLVPNLRYHFDLQGRNVVPADNDKNVFSWNPLENVVFDISVSAEYQFIRGCSNGKISQSDCIWKKRVEFVYQQCGCWPHLADITNPNNITACPVNIPTSIYTLTKEQYCNVNYVDFNQLDTSDCIPDCHRFTYHFTRQLASFFPRTGQRHYGGVESIIGNSLGAVEFRFTSNNYNLIAEVPTTDWDNFLGTWGGSIGTWLGASLLAFIHIPVYLFRECRFRKSTLTETSSE